MFSGGYILGSRAGPPLGRLWAASGWGQSSRQLAEVADKLSSLINFALPRVRDNGYL